MQTPVRKILESKGEQVHTIAPDATVLEAVSSMNDRRVGALVVVSGGGELVGIISERDVLSRVVAARKDPVSSLVSEVMTRGVFTIEPTTTIQDAMAVMTHKRCRHLPVLSNGALAGMISIGDVTRCSLRDQEFRINDLVHYITSA